MVRNLSYSILLGTIALVGNAQVKNVYAQTIEWGEKINLAQNEEARRPNLRTQSSRNTPRQVKEKRERYLYMGLGQASSNRNTSVKKTSPSSIEDIPGNVFFDEGNVGDATSMYLGVGAKFGKSLRAEIGYNTYHGFKYRDNGSWIGSSNQFTVSSIDGDIESHALGATVLWDFNGLSSGGGFGSITPYFGMGIGFDYNVMSDLELVTGGGISSSYVFPGKTTRNMYWKTTVGAAFKVSDNTRLEIAYKLMDMGDVKTAGFALNGDGSTFYQISQMRGNLEISEFMAGLRVDF